MNAREKRADLEMALALCEENERTHRNRALHWQREAGRIRQELHALNLTEMLGECEAQP